MKNYVLCSLGALIIIISCSTGDAGSSAVPNGYKGSSQALLFHNCRAVSEDEIEFDFSHPVTIKNISFEPEQEVVLIDEGKTVKVKLNKALAPGLLFTADLLAEDENRNSINVLVPFRSRNNNMPKMAINELRTENTKPKAEFIEFKMLSDGNLGAIKLFIASNNKEPLVYEFLPVDVKKDEYVVLHLRATEQDCIDEYTDDLSESGGTNSCPTARDFWIQSNTKLLRKTDIVYLLDQDEKVLDAVMFSENTDSWWSKEYFAEAATFLYEQGAWKSPDGKIAGPADSLISAKTTNTQTICRDESIEKTNTAGDWYITAKSCATPGKPNNVKRFE